MIAVSIDKEVQKAVSEFDKSLIPEDLAKADAFYNSLKKEGKLKKKESQLFPNEAYSYRAGVKDQVL